MLDGDPAIGRSIMWTVALSVSLMFIYYHKKILLIGLVSSVVVSVPKKKFIFYT
jgi:hypothetical protein